MSNHDWNSMLGGGPQRPTPSPPPEPEKQPAPPIAQDDASALLNAKTQQAIRENAEKAKAATKAAAVGAVHQAERWMAVVRLRLATMQLERANRRLERQAARVEAVPVRRHNKAAAFTVLGVAALGAGAAWLYLGTVGKPPLGAKAASTPAKPAPTLAPRPTPAPVHPDPIADVDAPVSVQASPEPTTPAPQATKATAVEVAKPLPPKPRPKAEPKANQPKKTRDDHAQWQDKANADLDSFFNQTKQ